MKEVNIVVNMSDRGGRQFIAKQTGEEGRNTGTKKLVILHVDLFMEMLAAFTL